MLSFEIGTNLAAVLTLVPITKAEGGVGGEIVPLPRKNFW